MAAVRASTISSGPPHSIIQSCHQSSREVYPVTCHLTLVFWMCYYTQWGRVRLLFGLSPASACKVGLPLPAHASVFARSDSDWAQLVSCGLKTPCLHHRHASFTHTPCSPKSKCRLQEQDQAVSAPGILVFGWRPPHMNVLLIRTALGRPKVPEPIAPIRHLTRLF